MGKIKEYFYEEIAEPNKQLMIFDIETIQGYFKMQDLNKWLKFNAISTQQIEKVDKFEEHLQKILERLCVPSIKNELNPGKNLVQ